MKTRNPAEERAKAIKESVDRFKRQGLEVPEYLLGLAKAAKIAVEEKPAQPEPQPEPSKDEAVESADSEEKTEDKAEDKAGFEVKSAPLGEVTTAAPPAPARRVGRPRSRG